MSNLNMILIIFLLAIIIYSVFLLMGFLLSNKNKKAQGIKDDN